MKYIVSLIISVVLVFIVIAMVPSQTTVREYGESYINNFDSDNNGFAVFQFSKKGKPYGAAVVMEVNDVHISPDISEEDIEGYTICIDTKNGLVYVNNEKVDVLNAFGLIRVDKNGELLKWNDGKAKNPSEGWEVMPSISSKKNENESQNINNRKSKEPK